MGVEGVDEQRRLVRALAHRLRDLRATRCWSQEDLADAAQLSPDSIRRIESAKMVPSLVTLHKLSQGLGLGLDTLIESISEGGARGPLAQLVDYMRCRSTGDVSTLLRVARAMFVERGGEPRQASAAVNE